MNLRLALYGFVIIWLVVTGIFYWQAPQFLASLQANLFAGAIDTVVVFIVLDGLLRADSRSKTRPFRFAAYKDAVCIFDSVCDLHHKMIFAASNRAPPPYRYLFSANNQDEISEHLDARAEYLRAPDGVAPKLLWRSHIVAVINDVTAQLKRWEDRYASQSDLYGSISKVAQLSTLREWAWLESYPESSTGLTFAPSYRSVEVPLLHGIYGCLLSASLEFQHIQGFSPPFDINNPREGSPPPNRFLYLGSARR